MLKSVAEIVVYLKPIWQVTLSKLPVPIYFVGAYCSQYQTNMTGESREEISYVFHVFGVEKWETTLVKCQINVGDSWHFKLYICIVLGFILFISIQQVILARVYSYQDSKVRAYMHGKVCKGAK